MKASIEIKIEIFKHPDNGLTQEFIRIEAEQPYDRNKEYPRHVDGKIFDTPEEAQHWLADYIRDLLDGTPKTGINLIAEERQRQMDIEGWTPEHDAQHTEGELANAAACYAMPDDSRLIGEDDMFAYLWPFDKSWWKPCPENRIKELAKAGALIAAEIDRLQFEEKEG